MTENNSKHIQAQRIEPEDRHFIAPSDEVSEHIFNESMRNHDCGSVTPEWLICPQDRCSMMVACKHCGRTIALLLPAHGGWCDLVEDERQHQLS